MSFGFWFGGLGKNQLLMFLEVLGFADVFRFGVVWVVWVVCVVFEETTFF